MGIQVATKPAPQWLVVSIAALLLFALAGKAHALDARVRSVTPNYETVQVAHQECRDVAMPVYPRYGDPGLNAGTVIGGVAGGVVGSTIGRGSGRTLATVAGALLGASVGHEVGRQPPRPPRYVTRTQCRTVWSPETRVRDYTVTYRLSGGETFSQRLPYAPRVGSVFHAHVYVDDAPAY
jgi:uncharacterized protein YcfJ